MKLGTENKKAVYALVTLVGLWAAYMIYDNFLSGDSSRPVAHVSAVPADPTASQAALPTTGDSATSGPPRAPASARNEEFKPKLRSKRPEDRVDVTKIDPTLRLDLLAKLQEIPAPAGTHNLFQIGPAPVTTAVLGPNETKIKTVQWGPRPLPPPPPPPPPPAPKQAVPINVKYYGWAAPSGTERKRAFFLDGDDVVMKYEGEAIKGHYRVVRIGPDKVVVEDVNDKLQQTLTKVEDSSG